MARDGENHEELAAALHRVAAAAEARSRRRLNSEPSGSSPTAVFG
jgi:hypothetical protein